MPRAPHTMEKPVPVALVVPVRSAVEKYLRKKLQLAPEQAFHLTKKVPAGRLLYHLLRNPQEDRQYAMSVAEYPGRLLVHISDQRAWLKGCRHLTAQAVHDFNRQVEDAIEEEFHNKLETLREYGFTFETKKEALRFLSNYGMTEDDVTLDALLKSYYRFRKALQEASKRAPQAAPQPALIPICPPLPLSLAA